MLSLRVGVDGDSLRKPLSGVGQYVFHLCRELELLLPKARFYAYARLPAERLALPSPHWTLRNEQSASARLLPSFVWLKTRGAEMCMRDRLDVFWATRTLHPRLPAPTITMCSVHDLNHLIVPSTMQWSTLLSYRLWFAGDLRRADRVIANSQGTAARLRSMLHAQVHDVVLPGLSSSFETITAEELDGARPQLTRLGIQQPYLLSVATLEPRKNVHTVLRAFLELKKSGALPHHRLVLVGPKGWSNRTLERDLMKARAEGVVLAGYVPDALLPAVYAQADALVFPSLYEGFGMPVLEARAAGTRVVISDVQELREAGGPLATVVQPTLGGVRDGILRALAQPRLCEETLAKQFAWREGAARLAAALTAAAQQRAMEGLSSGDTPLARGPGHL